MKTILVCSLQAFCAGGSPWFKVKVSEATWKEIVRKQKLFWKMWEIFTDELCRAIRIDAAAIAELPRSCDYWKDERMCLMLMLSGADCFLHEFDGCMYGFKTVCKRPSLPIEKPWKIVS